MTGAGQSAPAGTSGKPPENSAGLVNVRLNLLVAGGVRLVPADGPQHRRRLALCTRFGSQPPHASRALAHRESWWRRWWRKCCATAACLPGSGALPAFAGRLRGRADAARMVPGGRIAAVTVRDQEPVQAEGRDDALQQDLLVLLEKRLPAIAPGRRGEALSHAGRSVFIRTFWFGQRQKRGSDAAPKGAAGGAHSGRGQDVSPISTCCRSRKSLSPGRARGLRQCFVTRAADLLRRAISCYNAPCRLHGTISLPGFMR